VLQLQISYSNEFTQFDFSRAQKVLKKMGSNCKKMLTSEDKNGATVAH